MADPGRPFSFSAGHELGWTERIMRHW